MLIPELCYLTGTAVFGLLPLPLPLLGVLTAPQKSPYCCLIPLVISLTLHYPALQTFRCDPCFYNHIPFNILFEGLTDKMRNDFNVMKDLAVHTRLTPEQRQREVGRLIDYIHK